MSEIQTKKKGGKKKKKQQGRGKKKEKKVTFLRGRSKLPLSFTEIICE